MIKVAWLFFFCTRSPSSVRIPDHSAWQKYRECAVYNFAIKNCCCRRAAHVAESAAFASEQCAMSMPMKFLRFSCRALVAFVFVLSVRFVLGFCCLLFRIRISTRQKQLSAAMTNVRNHSTANWTTDLAAAATQQRQLRPNNN